MAVVSKPKAAPKQKIILIALSSPAMELNISNISNAVVRQ